MDLEGIRGMPEKVHRGSSKMENRDTGQCFVFGIEKPHELLGLPANETDAVRIAEAAGKRLETMRASTGSETEVRDCVISQIILAREAMLFHACLRCQLDETSEVSTRAARRSSPADPN